MVLSDSDGKDDRNGRKDPDNRRTKPISIRDAVGEGESVRESGSRPRSDEPRPPIPVRERKRKLLHSAASTAAEASAEIRTFSDGDVDWRVQVTGRGRSGAPPDAGVPLVHLTFTAKGEAGEARELLVAGEGVASLQEEELKALLNRSRPVRPDAGTT